MSKSYLLPWEVSLERLQMNRLQDHPLISMPGARGDRALFDSEHQAEVRCPVVKIGSVLRPSIGGNLDLTYQIPTVVHIESFRESGIIAVKLAFNDGYSPFVGRPFRGLHALGVYASSYGDDDSVEMGFKSYTAIVDTTNDSGRVLFERASGGAGVFTGLTNTDVTSLAAVGLYAYAIHTDSRTKAKEYANPLLYP